MSKSVGRPATVTDKTIVAVTSGSAQTKLQDASERRAIVNQVITEGGSASVAKLNKHFGYDVRAKVVSLISSGWLSVERA